MTFFFASRQPVFSYPLKIAIEPIKYKCIKIIQYTRNPDPLVSEVLSVYFHIHRYATPFVNLLVLVFAI